MTQLQQATVLITGAAGGFGRELTRQLLQAGSRLILTDLEEASLREQTVAMQDHNTTGEVLSTIAVDLSSRVGCERLYHRVNAMEHPIDILINNAGVGLYGRMDEVPPEEWERLMQINLLAPMRLSTLFVADMIARRQGHIVNISSVAGWVASAGLTHYGASKYGLRGFSEGLFNEVKAHNVNVTVVYPFFSRTPMLRSPAYGILAQDFQGWPDHQATDPAQIMAATLQGIVDNKLHVFPDSTAKAIHLLKRYAPWVLAWFTS